MVVGRVAAGASLEYGAHHAEQRPSGGLPGKILKREIQVPPSAGAGKAS